MASAWVEKVFNFVLEDKETQKTILKELSPDKQVAIMGRKGRITVKGEDGDSVFIIRLTPRGVFKEDDEEDIRNKIEMTEGTLMEILIWIAQLPENPGLSPRAAYVNGFLKIEGDSVLYDAEEIFSALEKHAFAKMGPIAKEAVMAMGKGKAE